MRMDLLEYWVFITTTHGGLSTLATSTEAYFHFATDSGLQGETRTDSATMQEKRARYGL